MNIRAVVDFGGPARAGQIVSVFNHGSQVLAAITDEVGTPIPNPTMVAKNGRVYFFAPPGSYDVVGPDLTRVAVLNAASASKSLAYMELPNTWQSGNVAAGNADIEVAGLQIAFLSGVLPFRVEANWALQFMHGTETLGAAVRLQIKIQQLNPDNSKSPVALAPVDGTTAANKFSTSMTKSGLIVPPADKTPYTFLVTVANNVAGSATSWFGRNLGSTSSLEAVER